MDAPPPQPESDLLKAAFKDALDRKGFGFQYAVSRRAHDLRIARKSVWVLEACEFPVRCQSTATHIDLLLRHADHRIYLVAECKRANPRFSDWCFVRAPYVTRDNSELGSVAEANRCDNDPSIVRSHIVELSRTADLYHVALELKNRSTTGDNDGAATGQINTAVTQVLRGMNGFIDWLASNEDVMRNASRASFFPVVFTTARLWVSSADIGASDLATGEIQIADASFVQKQVVYFQYHQSPDIIHSLTSASRPTEPSSALFPKFVRTVAIVSSAGVDSFLEDSSLPNRLAIGLQ